MTPGEYCNASRPPDKLVSPNPCQNDALPIRLETPEGNTGSHRTAPAGGSPIRNNPP